MPKQMVKSLDAYAREIGEWRRSKEFFTPDARRFEEKIEGLTHADAMLGKLMLVVSELAEAAEECRTGNYELFCTEIVDAFIRLEDIIDASGIPQRAVYEAKMDKNRERPIRHGKKTLL